MRPTPSLPDTADPRAADPGSAGRAVPLQRAPQPLFSDLLRQRLQQPSEEAENKPGGPDAPGESDGSDGSGKGGEAPSAPRSQAKTKRGQQEPLQGLTPAQDGPPGSPFSSPLSGAPPDDGRTPVPQAAPLLQRDEPWRQVARNLAHTVAAFCNDPAVKNSQDWRVQMELRPDVLVDTTLHLTLSPHWLHLRFHARDPSSHDLLFKGRDELVGILETSLERTLDIGIGFEPT